MYRECGSANTDEGAIRSFHELDAKCVAEDVPPRVSFGFDAASDGTNSERPGGLEEMRIKQ